MPSPRDILIGQKKTNFLPLPPNYVVKVIFPVSLDANVFQNFLSEFSLSAHFLSLCWECFPLTNKVNKFLSAVNMQISWLSNSSKRSIRVKLPDTTRARYGWNGWIHEWERTLRMSSNNRYLVTFNFHIMFISPPPPCTCV